MNIGEVVLVRGTISDLVVVDGKEDFVIGSAMKRAGGGAAAALALGGMAGAASGALLASTDVADSVQYFSIQLGGTQVTGRFSKIWFENGDDVEVVAEKQPDGSFLAYALRKQADKTLWMFPHFWPRGRNAHRLYVIKAFAILIGVWVGWFWVSKLIADLGMVDDRWFAFMIGCGVSVAVFMLFVPFDLPVGRKWKVLASRSETVFSALGYANPQYVDMEIQNRRYWKDLAQAGEHPKVAPWVYRYVEST